MKGRGQDKSKNSAAQADLPFSEFVTLNHFEKIQTDFVEFKQFTHGEVLSLKAEVANRIPGQKAYSHDTHTDRDREALFRCLQERIISLEYIIEKLLEDPNRSHAENSEIITKLETSRGRNTNTNEDRLNSTTNSDTSHNSSTSHSSRMPIGIRLPKFNLPCFNGDVTRFQAFWQSFTCNIDENEDLPKIQKLNYLINSLEGQAFKAVEGLDIAEDDYEAAKDILKSKIWENPTNNMHSNASFVKHGKKEQYHVVERNL